MGRSILRIDTADDKHALFMCGNRKCSAGISNIAYSAYHAGLLGWRRMELPKDEAEAYGAKFLPLCPECAKNTGQQVQPDNGPVKCTNKNCHGYDEGFCAIHGSCREGAVLG